MNIKVILLSFTINMFVYLKSKPKSSLPNQNQNIDNYDENDENDKKEDIDNQYENSPVEGEDE